VLSKVREPSPNAIGQVRLALIRFTHRQKSPSDSLLREDDGVTNQADLFDFIESTGRTATNSRRSSPCGALKKRDRIGYHDLMSLTLENEKVVGAPNEKAAPRSFTISWLFIAVGGVSLLLVLWRVWMSLPEMNDRFLIPIAAAWLVHRNRARWQSTPLRPSRWGLAWILVGALMWPPAWYLVIRVGPRVLLLWWLAAALAIAAFGLVIAQFGWRRAWLTAFPIAFCFLALPTPDRLQTPIQLRLKEYTTSATAAALPALGIPVVRRGHVLDLPSGPPLGVVDACSGV